ncbi:MAG: DUF2487 family protein [Tuberibacillus sp.]
MRWAVTDMQKYVEQKAYIDTVIIPLVPIAWEEQDLIPTVREGEFIHTILAETERQLHGRVILIPPLTYLKSESKEEKLERIHKWGDEIKKENIKYVFFVTSDADWKKAEDELNSLIWAAPIPLEHMDDRYRKDFVDETVRLIMKQITEMWRKS